jgi:hypothetical protein
VNPYLRTGGRIVGAIVFALGVVMAATGVFLVVEAVPYWMNRGAFGGSRSAWHAARAAVGCGVLSFVCFRYWSRLRKEERQGIQI